jgi:hypothetical protein
MLLLMLQADDVDKDAVQRQMPLMLILRPSRLRSLFRGWSIVKLNDCFQ